MSAHDVTTTLLPGALRTRVEHVWGTVVSIDVRDAGTTDAVVDAAWASVRAELHRVDEVFSTFRADSVISGCAAAARTWWPTTSPT